jgi:hypothetical protein
LSLFSVDDNKAAAGELKAKWIYMELLGCIVKPTTAKVIDLETRLGELHADGTPTDIVDGLQTLLKKVRDRLESAIKAEADRVAEEKRKLEERRAAQNFYYKATVGEWITYKRTDGSPDPIKIIVVKKDDKSVTVVGDFRMRDRNPKTEWTINLLEPYSFKDMLCFTSDAKKTDEGEETITVGGKSYKCKREFYWDAWHRNPRNHSEFVEVEHQVWYSPDAPLSGVVKYQMKWIKSHDPHELPYEGLFGFLGEIGEHGTAGK